MVNTKHQTLNYGYVVVCRVCVCVCCTIIRYKHKSLSVQRRDRQVSHINTNTDTRCNATVHRTKRRSTTTKKKNAESGNNHVYSVHDKTRFLICYLVLFALEQDKPEDKCCLFFFSPTLFSSFSFFYYIYRNIELVLYPTPHTLWIPNFIRCS